MLCLLYRNLAASDSGENAKSANLNAPKVSPRNNSFTITGFICRYVQDGGIFNVRGLKICHVGPLIVTMFLFRIKNIFMYMLILI